MALRSLWLPLETRLAAALLVGTRLWFLGPWALVAVGIWLLSLVAHCWLLALLLRLLLVRGGADQARRNPLNLSCARRAPPLPGSSGADPGTCPVPGLIFAPAALAAPIKGPAKKLKGRNDLNSRKRVALVRAIPRAGALSRRDGP